MLMPQKTKFRKQMRGRMQGDAQTGNVLSFGSFGLQATGRGYVTTRQIEAARRVIARTLKRGGKNFRKECASVSAPVNTALAFRRFTST